MKISKRVSANKKAVVLLSGGLDSATTLFWALGKGYHCQCLIFDYGQKHKREIEVAKKLVKAVKSKSNFGRVAGCQVVKIELPWKGSSLLDRTLKVPTGRSYAEIRTGIPTTYVPARNTILLSFAASFAEARGAENIFIGAHLQDSSGYPDCRREYLEAFKRVLKTGTRKGIEGRLRLKYPLIERTKREIIHLGVSLGVPFEFTWSCYYGKKRPCGKCDSCLLRKKGFKEAGLTDPLDKDWHAH